MGRVMSNGSSVELECHKQVRSWSLLRSLIQLLIPTCNCTTTTTTTTIIDGDDDDFNNNKDNHNKNAIVPDKCNIPNYYSSSPSPLLNSTTTTITGTIFRYQRGKLSLCIQTHPNSTHPLLLLQLAVPTNILAKEMREGSLRIVLESTNSSTPNNNIINNTLFSTPLWIMYCNGRKVGYAVKRRSSSTDLQALTLLRSVTEGTGVIKKKEFMNEEEEDDHDDDDQVMYLRANFRRVRGSKDSESFHLIDPDQGAIDQDLSIFFFRSINS